MSDLSKEELTEQMNLKNRKLLLEPDGMESLFIYNLEQFAYRYLETSKSKDIKCQFEKNRFWVESIEPNIVEALKLAGPELKKKLIELCKKHPGNESKDIQIRAVLETKAVESSKNECKAIVYWKLPSEDEKQFLERSVEFSFEDPIELRNKHAALLEQVCEIF